MRISLIFIIALLLILSACQKTEPKTQLQPTQNNVEPKTTDTPPRQETPPVILEDTIILNDCPQFSDLKAQYSDQYRSYISILSEYHALFKTSKDVQGYKIRGGVGSKGDILVYCTKGIESLRQDSSLIYCSGDNTDSPIFTETFIKNPDNSTKKTQKKITLIFNLDGSFYISECK